MSTAEEGNSRLGLASQHVFGHEAFPGLGDIAAAEQHDDPLVCIPSDRHALQQAIGPMTREGWGRIINISSVGARTGGGAGSIPYHVAKAGPITLTKGVAKELAMPGITVNTVAPGIIETPFHDRHTAAETRAEWIRTLIPMQRAGEASEVAAAVVFIAPADAAYIAGATLDVK